MDIDAGSIRIDPIMSVFKIQIILIYKLLIKV